MPQHRAPSPGAARDGFRPDVQGLRALAVALVVGYHLYPGALTGGYVGVDVFFVISGYLITGLLLRGVQHTGHVNLLGFYARRARRLLPAAVLVLTVTWLVSRVLLPVTQLPDTATQIRASALYVQNWVLAHNSVDYLKSESAPTPVQHFWSLSVEEQFYLVWPLIFVIALALGLQAWRHRVSLGLAATVVVVSLVYSLHETASNPAAAYFQTTTRMWELGLGGVLALLPVRATDRVGRVGVLSWLGLAMIVAASVIDDAHTPFPGTAALVPVVGAALMLMCGSSSARLGTAPLTSVRPAVFVGDLSYSIYLWHWPMIVLWKAYAGPTMRPLDGPALALAAVLAAYLSTRLVENPIRYATVFTRSSIRGLAVASFAIVPIVLASLFLSSQAPPSSNTIDAAHAGAEIIAPPPASTPTPSPSRTVAAPEKVQWLPASAAHTLLSPESSKIIPSLATVDSDLAVAAHANCKADQWTSSVLSCTYGDIVHPRLTVALVGDSHAAQWSTALATIASAQHWRLVVITHDSCIFGATMLELQSVGKPFTSCHVWDERVLADLENNIKPDVAILTSRAYVGVPGHNVGDATSFAAIGRGMAGYWRDLLAHHIRVVAIHETPEPGMSVPDCLASHGATVASCGVSTKIALTRNTPTDVASKIVGSAVPVVQMNNYLCTRTVCPAVVGNVIVYRDKHHITATYTKSITPFLQEELLEIPALSGVGDG